MKSEPSRLSQRQDDETTQIKVPVAVSLDALDKIRRTIGLEDNI